MDLNEMQKAIWQNKVNKGFNTTDVNLEFCYIMGELGEAHNAYLKKKDDLGEELADVAIYLMGLSQMLGKNLKQEIENKIEKNKGRIYELKDGVLQKTTE